MSSERPPCAAAEPRRRLKDHLRRRQERVASLCRDLIALLETDAETEAETDPFRQASNGSAGTSAAARSAVPRATTTGEAIRAARGQLGAVRPLGARLR